MTLNGWLQIALFGEISATTFFNRVDGTLATLLRRTDLHPRLVNGSDYPLPAINALIRTGKLESLGLITAEQRKILNEIDRHNPLAFDFALKRSVRAGGRGFADRVFTHGAELVAGVRPPVAG